jgi:peptidyl-tRNA hydrolase
MQSDSAISVVPASLIRTHKMIIVVNPEVRFMSLGKVIAQSTHAVLESLRKAPQSDLAGWKDSKEPIVVLYAPSQEMFFCLCENAKTAGLTTGTWVDAVTGRSSALAVGPNVMHQVDALSRGLQLYC